MVKVKQNSKRDYQDYRIQLQLLRNYLQLKKNRLVNGELDLRVGAVLSGYKEAGLTDEQLKVIEEEKKAIYKKYGR